MCGSGGRRLGAVVVPATAAPQDPAPHGAERAAVHGEVTATRQATRRLLAALLALAWLHGSLYAGLMPPWGLIDEAQHVHYVQHLAEGRGRPVVGETYLSDEIIASQFATKRWEVFHWTPPASANPAQMGLQAHSYEAYQPPLYYALMLPAYWALPGDILDKLFGLRWVMVALSLIPVWAVFACARWLRPDDLRFAALATLLYISLPERTMAVSRVNNDGLLEVWTAAALVVLTVGLFAGLTPRRSFTLGLLVGLAVWTKAPAALMLGPVMLALWFEPWPAARRAIAAAGGIVTLFSVAAIVRNFALYGDATGFAGFRRVHDVPFAPGPSAYTLPDLAATLAASLHHTFLVWWKGSVAATNPLVTGFYWLMTLVVLFAAVQVARTARGRAGRVALVYAGSVVLYLAAVIFSYYAGMVPVVQGRLLLPALPALALLMAWGLYERPRPGAGAHWARPWVVLALIGVLAAMDAVSLFGNLLPFHYYWSGIVAGTIPAGLTLTEQVAVAYGRLAADKPGWVAQLIPVWPVGYALGWAFVLGVVAKVWGQPTARPVAQQAVDAPMSLHA
jgi:hypothetical protein